MINVSINVFRYMVDAADPDKIEASRNELHNLLEKQQLTGIPVLVLGNKRDLPNALDEHGLIERMWVAAIKNFFCRVYHDSAKYNDCWITPHCRQVVYFQILIITRLFAGTYQLFKTAKFVVIQSRARRRITSTSRYNGSSSTVSLAARAKETLLSASGIHLHESVINNIFLYTWLMLKEY